MVICDFCGEPKKCSPRHIESREYDICSDCWTPIAAKLKGKGRVPEEAAVVLLPAAAPRPEPVQPPPEHPPKIWARA